MTTTPLNVTPQDVLHAAEQLTTADFARVVEDILALRARRAAPVLTANESVLLEKINFGLSPSEQARYNKLIDKRLAETLTEAEHQELLTINQQVERLNVERVKNLIELAKLRHISLPQLIKDLGILPTYVS